MKKLCYWILVFVLIISVGYLHYENAKIDDRMTALANDFAKDIDVLSKQTDDTHKLIDDIQKRTDDVCDRVSTIEQDWQRVHGPIPAGSDEMAVPTEPYDDKYADDEDYTNFYGRLYIPEAELDVALYCGNAQYITDRQDSANIYNLDRYNETIIADHCNQDFAKLFSVDVGMTGFIRLKDGDIINIKCVDVFDGHNTRYELTDETGECVQSDADYLMYTCRNGWYNIRIWLWDVI